MKYRVIIASDQTEDVDVIQQVLKTKTFVSDVLVAHDKASAMAAFASQTPDFAIINPFLFKSSPDAPMPGRRYRFPVIVYSADCQCAIEAFALRATDFVPSPIQKARLEVAIERAVSELNRELIAELHALKADNQVLTRQFSAEEQKKLVIRETGRIRLIKQRDIRFVKGAGNYVELHLEDGSKIMHRGTLMSIEKELDPNVFCRIHKSALVQSNLVEELRPMPKGDYKVKPLSGEHFTLSRSNRDKLHKLINASG